MVFLCHIAAESRLQPITSMSFTYSASRDWCSFYNTLLNDEKADCSDRITDIHPEFAQFFGP
jgi:hypothetical protein